MQTFLKLYHIYNANSSIFYFGNADNQASSEKKIYYTTANNFFIAFWRLYFHHIHQFGPIIF